MTTAIVMIDGRPGRRDALPTNPAKKWRYRDPAKTKGITVHHTAGGDDPVATAEYHCFPNHTSDDGMAGLAYTFYVRQNGDVWRAWDLDQQTWSQGGGRAPDMNGDGVIDAKDGDGRHNQYFVAIVLGGSFDSKWNKTGQNPTFRQLLALNLLIGHLTGESEYLAFPDDLFGALGHLDAGDVVPHSAFGKAACPGETTEQLIDVWHKACPGTRVHWYDADWQMALVARGYDLGSYGPNGDGVDGHWGNASRKALIQFQRDEGLPQTGDRDLGTEAALFD